MLLAYLVSFTLGISVVGIIAGIRLFRQLKEIQQQVINLQKELAELDRHLIKVENSVDGKLGLVNQEIDSRFNQIGKTLNQEMEQVEERVKFLSKRVSQEY
jgi:replicative DNA helicase